MDARVVEKLVELEKQGIIGLKETLTGKETRSIIKETPSRDTLIIKDTKPVYVSEQIMKVYDLIFYGGQLWYNYKGCYRPAEMEIRNFLQNKLGDKFSSHIVREVIYALASRVFLEEVEEDQCWISFKNGIYNWIDDEFYEHGIKNDVKFMNQIPVDFRKEATCPKINKFLSEIVDDDSQRVFLQFLGYCLIPTTRFEKAMMFIGDGANGKSTLLKLMIAMIGQENISNLSLFDLEQQFRLSGIVGKLVNIFSDLPNKKVTESSIFKAVVSGDPIIGERKYVPHFTFKPFARLLFATNNLPATQDISPAFFRRWLIIEFPNTFNGKKRDPGLLSKLSTPEELAGLVQLSIRGLHELYSDEEFTEGARMKEMLTDYEKKNNPVAYFTDERCEFYPGAEIPKGDLYDEYRQFAFDEKLPMLGKKGFAQELVKQIPSISESRDASRKWRGISLIKEQNSTLSTF